MVTWTDVDRVFGRGAAHQFMKLRAASRAQHARRHNRVAVFATVADKRELFASPLSTRLSAPWFGTLVIRGGGMGLILRVRLGGDQVTYPRSSPCGLAAWYFVLMEEDCLLVESRLGGSAGNEIGTNRGLRIGRDRNR
ncbi:hypothetical protein GCM10022261_00320 [Brevibacterium daeguense]|uniref:Uncharacterized protein n=1 Tax=Brevibacterium daeguense TaxID=909936 RepID=A0ABP8EEZ3_9MICO